MYASSSLIYIEKAQLDQLYIFQGDIIESVILLLSLFFVIFYFPELIRFEILLETLVFFRLE